MLELRSFQSLAGRIKRNIAAQLADTACKMCVGLNAIVAASEVAVDMSSGGNDAIEAFPTDKMAD